MTSGCHLWRRMSTRPDGRNVTPSDSRSRRCECQCGAVRPCELTTLWQGTGESIPIAPSTFPTRRACDGNPASAATSPYVATDPAGIASVIWRTEAEKPQRL